VTTTRATGSGRIAAALVWLGALWFSLVTLVFLNDHFGRISPARQIAVFGELPFRDYFDPGYFLTELSTAALMRLLGSNLLGEVLLTTTCIATGTLLVYLLARRLTGSVVASLACAGLALSLLPRAYDYDKVLFYPLGLMLCWRYVDRPGAGRLWACAAGLVVAALFRYDNGVFLGAATVVTIGVAHAGDWGLAARRVGGLLMAAGCLALPVLIVVQLQIGLADAIDQMITYGRRETVRTQLAAQSFVFESFQGLGSVNNADAFLFHLVRLMPLAGALLLVVDLRSHRASREAVAQLLGLVTLCVCLNVFILRDPIGARLGGMAGPFAILAVWIAHRAWGAWNAARLAVVGLFALALSSAFVSADWKGRVKAEMIRPPRLVEALNAWAASPPPFEAIPNRAIEGLARYVRECTAPTDRLFATWFVPDLYFYAQRGFAGRIVALFGGHWSEERFQRRSVDALASQSVPIVITRTGDERFREDYPQIDSYIRDHYSLAGTSDFGDVDIGQDGYSVWVRLDRAATEAYAGTSFPCFR
jgi:hypothetical protein